LRYSLGSFKGVVFRQKSRPAQVTEIRNKINELLAALNV
jgi:hypothetical protein